MFKKLYTSTCSCYLVEIGIFNHLTLLSKYTNHSKHMIRVANANNDKTNAGFL